VKYFIFAKLLAHKYPFIKMFIFNHYRTNNFALQSPSVVEIVLTCYHMQVQDVGVVLSAVEKCLGGQQGCGRSELHQVLLSQVEAACQVYEVPSRQVEDLTLLWR
jgi:hypothetical protein